jgi:hypothetical protein
MCGAANTDSETLRRLEERAEERWKEE